MATVVRAGEIDDGDLGRIGEQALLPINKNGAGLDPVPQRVADFHIFVSLIVALVVLDLIKAERAMFSAQMP